MLAKEIIGEAEEAGDGAYITHNEIIAMREQQSKGFTELRDEKFKNS